jgi:Ni,Fe-hydrogenase III small subunit
MPNAIDSAEEKTMSKWVWKGMKTGKKTTGYPDVPETAAGVSPGLPDGATGTIPAGRCPCSTDAGSQETQRMKPDIRRCLHCFRCHPSRSGQPDWQGGYEWAAATAADAQLGAAFSHSVHLRMVDAGACDACISEVKQIGKPYYNIHRLGFFLTPTPRHADVLLVVGPVPENMVLPLKKTFDAMPAPKRVVAAGTCALTGCVFGPNFTAGSGVADVIPVDVEVPGCPPPPLALVHALLVAVGRKPSASMAEKATKGERSRP